MDQASENPEPAQAVPVLEALVFAFAAERFALPLGDVLEVVRAVAIRALPGAPAVVEGIIDVRGELLPVFDLRARLGLAHKPLAPSDHLVIAQARARKVVLRVDQAIALERLEVVSLVRAVNLPRGLEHVTGIASTADGLILIHDLHAFLTEAEALALERALDDRSSAESARG